jgi:hypothetical protein
MIKKLTKNNKNRLLINIMGKGSWIQETKKEIIIMICILNQIKLNENFIV